MNNKLKFVFALSLALNLFLVGFVAGKGCFFGCKMPPHGGMAGFNKEALINVLSPEKRARAGEVFDKMRKAHQDGFAKNKAVFAEIEKIVIAPEFDKERFLKSLNVAHSAMIAGKAESDKMVADFLATLTAEERKALSEEFKKSREGFYHAKGGKHPRPERLEKPEARVKMEVREEMDGGEKEGGM